MIFGTWEVFIAANHEAYRLWAEKSGLFSEVFRKESSIFISALFNNYTKDFFQEIIYFDDQEYLAFFTVLYPPSPLKKRK